MRTMSTISTGERKKLSYFREVQNELKKVTWTPKEELLLSTKAVIFATLLFGLAIYLVDLLIRGGLEGISALFRLVFG